MDGVGDLRREEENGCSMIFVVMAEVRYRGEERWVMSRHGRILVNPFLSQHHVTF
jgi:hypothetical protein